MDLNRLLWSSQDHDEMLNLWLERFRGPLSEPLSARDWSRHLGQCHAEIDEIMSVCGLSLSTLADLSFLLHITNVSHHLLTRGLDPVSTKVSLGLSAQSAPDMQDNLLAQWRPKQLREIGYRLLYDSIRTRAMRMAALCLECETAIDLWQVALGRFLVSRRVCHEVPGDW